VNAASGATGVTASASTTATLDMSALGAYGTISLKLQGAPTSAGAANPIAISATVSSKSDLGALTKAINDQAGSTGITAIADSSKGTITLTQAQGYDIGMVNMGTTTGMKLTGLGTADGGTGTAVTLAANATAGDAATVGGKLTFNSPSSFTTTTTAAGITATTGATSSALSAVSSIDITTMTNGVPSGANDALQVIDSALSNISTSRASLGALQNRFTQVVSSLSTTSENLSAARSRVLDADFASETANMTRAQILQQAGTAMLSQANQLPNNVLTLLRG
jgi:flagellin